MWSLGFSDKSVGSVAALRATQARPIHWQRLMAEKLRRPHRTGGDCGMSRRQVCSDHGACRCFTLLPGDPAAEVLFYKHNQDHMFQKHENELFGMEMLDKIYSTKLTQKPIYSKYFMLALMKQCTIF